MNAGDKAALVTKLQSLLTEAGLPEERELIGRKFALTYEVVQTKGGGMDGLVRVSGTIHGIESGSEFDGFSLITSSLPRKRSSDIASPSISFGVNGRRNPQPWSIHFRHHNNEGRYDSSQNEVFFGELDLL